MIVTAWKNGKHRSRGVAYGIRLKAEDRKAYFRKSWRSVFLKLEGKSKLVEVNIKKESFWGSKRPKSTDCRELIHKEIRAWLKRKFRHQWKKRHPTKLIMEHLKGRKFVVFRFDVRDRLR